MTIVLMFVLGAVAAGVLTPVMLRLLVVMRQRNADEDAQQAVEDAAMDDGATFREAWRQSRGVTAPPVDGPVVANVRLLVASVALVAGVLCAAFTALLPAALVPLFAYLSVAGTWMAVSDLRTTRLPNMLAYPSYVIVPALLVVAGLMAGEWPIGRVLWSAAAWLLFFGALLLLSGGRAVGLGDVKLAPICGAALGAIGWGASGFGWFAGLFIGGVIGMALVSVGRTRPMQPIPYGPWMLAGVVVGALVGEPLMMAWLTDLGLV